MIREGTRSRRAGPGVWRNVSRAAIVGPHPARKRAGYWYEGRLRGLNQPAKAGFVLVAGGFNRPAA
jgi:hypothetical protein